MTSTNPEINQIPPVTSEKPPKQKRHPNRIKESKLDVGVSVTNAILLTLFCILVAFPLLSFFSLGFNDSAYNSQVILFPSKISWVSFRYILTGTAGAEFWRAFLNSVIITVIVTIVSNLVEAMAAYPLSKSDCPIRSGIMMFFIITMLFSAGIAPIRMLMRALHLTDNIWSIILISISNVGNLLFFKTFFEGLPGNIEEAARIDGASELQMFFRIVIPMSLPVFGSCCFFTIVGCWNGYGSALLFISSTAKDAQPLAYYLVCMIADLQTQKNNPELVSGINNIQSAAMFLSVIPILCIYPYVINYIKNGLTLGSVKE